MAIELLTLSHSKAVIYHDTRLYGCNKAIYGDPIKASMRIPDELIDCVAFLCIQDRNGKFSYKGTGFFVRVKSANVDADYGYLVTAKHCIEKAKALGSPLYARINTTDGGCEFLQISGDWLYPQDEGTDVAVLPLLPDTGRYFYRLIPNEMFATDEIIVQASIGVGEDLIITGLFSSHYGKRRNVPIVRLGTIAAMPDEPLEDRDTGFSYKAYLAEMRSIGGLSGSPVFTFFGSVRNSEGSRVFSPPKLLLLGLIRGHWDVQEEKDAAFMLNEARQVNQGIAIVTPAQEIEKIINGEYLVKARRRRDKEWQNENAPTLD